MIKEKTFSGFNAPHRLLARVLAATWWPNGFNWIMSFVPWPRCMDPYGAPLVLFYLPVSMIFHAGAYIFHSPIPAGATSTAQALVIEVEIVMKKLSVVHAAASAGLKWQTSNAGAGLRDILTLWRHDAATLFAVF